MGANMALFGAVVAHMIKEEVAVGRWTIDADGRARPLDRCTSHALKSAQMFDCAEPQYVQHMMWPTSESEEV